MNKSIIIILGIVGIFMAILLTTSFIGKDNQSSKLKLTSSPGSTPFLFQEITIPYLRARIYQSKLGEMQRVYDYLSYTEYLTSYDSDGLKINGLLTKPTGEVPAGGWPAIVFVHGYIPPN